MRGKQKITIGLIIIGTPTGHGTCMRQKRHRPGRVGGSLCISHFLFLHSFNYIGRLLRGPGIIGIILHKLHLKYMR